jgi:hypothetical protein
MPVVEETVKDPSSQLLVTVVLACEWAGELIDCPMCEAPSGIKYGGGSGQKVTGKHNPNCLLDEALRREGLETNEQREAERELRRKT